MSLECTGVRAGRETDKGEGPTISISEGADVMGKCGSFLRGPSGKTCGKVGYIGNGGTNSVGYRNSLARPQSICVYTGIASSV